MRSFYAETCVGVTYIFVFREKKNVGDGETQDTDGGDNDVVRSSCCVTYATLQTSPISELYAYPELIDC